MRERDRVRERQTERQREREGLTFIHVPPVSRKARVMSEPKATIVVGDGEQVVQSTILALRFAFIVTMEMRRGGEEEIRR